MAAAPGSPSRPSWPGRAVTEWMETHHWTPASRDVLTTRRREDGVIVVSMQPIANPLWKARGPAAPSPAMMAERRRRFRTFESAKPATELEA